MNPHFSRLATRYPDLESLLPELQKSYEILENCFQNGGKLLVCGNGGSAADCEHIVGEMVNKFCLPRPISDEKRAQLDQFGAEGQFLADHLQNALPAISLVSQTALLTAVCNDVEAQLIFAQQVWAYAKPGDCVLAISTSGNSHNILHALRAARVLGVHTIGLTGRDGGKMRGLCDACLVAPAEITAEIQERHLPIYHALCAALEERFFG